jgi:large subunit ribosomal protein L22
VLDLIRNESVEDARTILQFSETGVSETISKVLESAIANAGHNDGIAEDELYVAACYADEGATMKRFRPRARGRASRINKRTSHITVIVARYETEELEVRRERQASRGGTSAAQAEARRRRVQRSQAATDDHAEDVAEDTTATTEEEE